MYYNKDSELIKKILDDKIFNGAEQQVILSSMQVNKKLSKKNYNELIEEILKKNGFM